MWTETVITCSAAVMTLSWFYLYRHRCTIRRMWRAWMSPHRHDVHVTDGTITINYYAHNRPYCITLPYAPHRRSSMMPLQVFLHKDGQNFDITHQEGVPYLCSAGELGGQYIEVVNQDLDETYLYHDQAPGYCIEILDSF